ncbi:potassium channel family protein [Candidatus Margulisiibacteriota bacterium]
MKKKILISVFFLLFTFIVGILGYKFLVGPHITVLDCIYMVFITLSTVGFGEIFDLSNNPAARALTMVLILMGMSNLFFVVSTFTALLVEGKLNRILWRRKVMRTIKNYQDHFIVCGSGKIGNHIIEELLKTKNKFVVIEKDAEQAEVMKERFSEVPIINGDATVDEVLMSAGIEKAKGLASVLPSDKDNLFLTLTAHHLNNKLRIITKLIDLDNHKKMIKAGATSIVPPNFIGAMRVASELIRPAVVGFLDIMLRDKRNLRVEELEVKKESWIVGKTLGEIQLRQKAGLQVAALQNIKKNEIDYYPQGNTVITEDTIMIVIGEPDKLKKLAVFVK